METTQALPPMVPSSLLDNAVVAKSTSPLELLYRKKLFRPYTVAAPSVEKQPQQAPEPKVYTSSDSYESESEQSVASDTKTGRKSPSRPVVVVTNNKNKRTVSNVTSKKRKRAAASEVSSDEEDESEQDDDAYEPPSAKKKTVARKSVAKVAVVHTSSNDDDEEEEEESRSKGKGRGRGRNSSMPGITCHQCKQKTMETKSCCQFCYLRYNPYKSSKNIEQHPIADWQSFSSHFCSTCLKNRYGQDVDFKNGDLPQEWKCPICEGICNCSSCRRRSDKVPYSVTTREALKRGYSNVNEMLIAEGMER